MITFKDFCHALYQFKEKEGTLDSFKNGDEEYIKKTLRTYQTKNSEPRLSAFEVITLLLTNRGGYQILCV